MKFFLTDFTTSHFDDRHRPHPGCRNKQEKKKHYNSKEKKILLRADSIWLDGVPLHFLFSPVGTKHWVGLTTTLQFRAKIGLDKSRTQNTHSKVTAENHKNIEIRGSHDRLQIFLKNKQSQEKKTEISNDRWRPQVKTPP